MTELRKVVAVDFDGTLCEVAFPDIGQPKPAILDYVKHLKSDGWAVILWTNREGKLLEDAVRWCHDQGLYFDAVNQNLLERTEYYGSDCRKIGADLYIDDKSIPPALIERAIEILEDLKFE